MRIPWTNFERNCFSFGRYIFKNYGFSYTFYIKYFCNRFSNITHFFMFINFVWDLLNHKIILNLHFFKLIFETVNFQFLAFDVCLIFEQIYLLFKNFLQKYIRQK